MKQETKSVGQMIRKARLNQGLTQKALGQKVGISPSFVAKIESSDSFPSYPTCISLSKALDVPFQEIWNQVQEEQNQIAQGRLLTRGAALRPTPIAKAMVDEAGLSEALAEARAERERLSDWLSSTDPDVKTALQHLQVALADPQMRQAVLTALEAFARAAHAEEHPSRKTVIRK